MYREILLLDEDYKTSSYCLNDDYIRNMPMTILRLLCPYAADVLSVELKEKYYVVPVSYSHFYDYLRQDPDKFPQMQKYLKILLNEYRYRFGKTHPCAAIATEILLVTQKDIHSYCNYHHMALVFPLQVPTEYHIPLAPRTAEAVNLKKVVKIHRNFYKAEHSDGVFTKRIKPKWISHDRSDQEQPVVQIRSF